MWLDDRKPGQGLVGHLVWAWALRSMFATSPVIARPRPPMSLIALRRPAPFEIPFCDRYGRTSAEQRRDYFPRAGSEITLGISMFAAAFPKALH